MYMWGREAAEELERAPLWAELFRLAQATPLHEMFDLAKVRAEWRIDLALQR